jgi:phage major head subunit gpT-like protein
MPGVVSSSNFGELLEPGLRKIFFETYDEVPEQFSQVFKVKSSTKAKEEDFHMAGVGLWEEKESMGPVNYETIEPGLSATYTHKEYAKGIQVERKFVDDEQYDQIEKLPKSIARKGRATVEIIAAAVLNNAFSVDGYDGEPMISNDHPLTKARTVGQVGDNHLGKVALDEAGIKSALTLARKTVDETGILITSNPKKLIVPPDLEFTALVTLQSALKPGSANNDKNVIQGRLSPVVLDYLTDANAWFVMDPDLAELIFFWRIRPEFNRDKNFDTMISKFIGYLRFSVGYSDWRGIVGSNPD